MEIDYTKVVAEAAKEIAKDAYDDAAHPAAQNVGGAMGTLTGFFNHVVLYPLKKLNTKYEQKAIAWQRDMENKYNAIPEENRVEPQLNIVGPTLESMKYNIMDDDLAEMFSNLLVSDMDESTQGLCTPSFVKVIEQLTPNDATAFKVIFSKYQNSEPLPICRIQFIEKDNPTYILSYEAYPTYYTNLLIPHMNGNAIAKSLQNLNRLGLVDLIEDVRYYKDSTLYDNILNSTNVSQIIQLAKDLLGKEMQASYLSRGYIQINDFARDFAKVCLRNS